MRLNWVPRAVAANQGGRGGECEDARSRPGVDHRRLCDTLQSVAPEGLLEAVPYDANYNDFRVLQRMDHPGLLLQAGRAGGEPRGPLYRPGRVAAAAPPKGPIGTCIWLARLYADKDMMQAVKDIVRQTLAPFEAAMQLLLAAAANRHRRGRVGPGHCAGAQGRAG